MFSTVLTFVESQIIFTDIPSVVLVFAPRKRSALAATLMDIEATLTDASEKDVVDPYGGTAPVPSWRRPSRPSWSSSPWLPLFGR